MITKLHIENFKSLANFDLPPGELRLGGFTCLVGMNGSGKTTLLQAFDFLGQLALGKMADWLGSRDWKGTELTCHLGRRSPLIEFRVTFEFEQFGTLVWEGRFNTSPKQMRCTWERITKGGTVLLELAEGRLRVAADGDGKPEQTWERLDFSTSGSVLSFLKLTGAHRGIISVKEELIGLKSLELLSPQAMRRRARKADDIGVGGEKLSAFLGSFTQEQRALLVSALRGFYPMLRDWNVQTLKYGWKNLRVVEDYGGPVAVSATHVNDGLLRILAVLAQAYSTHKILLFDEIENGINPELVGRLVAFLVGLDRQVIVTTHSPMILNYLPDEVAHNAVMLLYKPADGRTRCVRFFDIPEMKNKLRALGPGEVFVDTNLTELTGRLPVENIEPAQ